MLYICTSYFAEGRPTKGNGFAVCERTPCTDHTHSLSLEC